MTENSRAKTFMYCKFKLPIDLRLYYEKIENNSHVANCIHCTNSVNENYDT